MIYDILRGTQRRTDRLPQFQAKYKKINVRFGRVLISPEVEICPILELSICEHQVPGRSFRHIVEAWHSIISCLDKETQGLIREYRAMLNAFKPQPRDEQ
jgi:hypothetical protein